MTAAGADEVALLVADVDGTLVTTDKVLTPRARAAVLALKARGIKFAITSGRPPRGMGMLVGPLEIATPIAGFNGGMFVQPDMSELEARPLEPAVARQALALVLDHGLDAWVYRDNRWLVRDAKGAHVAREQWTVKFPPTVVADLAPALDAAVKIVGVSDDHERVQRAEADAGTALGNRASAVRSQPYYLDITHPNANKGAVVDCLARIFAVAPHEIATIGDMPNDILMFRKSGLSIAMGNASPEVQKEAHFVTASCDEDGFAKAVERHLLGATGG